MNTEKAKTKQDYATPPKLIEWIKQEFGVEFFIDLAAHSENHVVPNYLGPGSLIGANALNFPHEMLEQYKNHSGSLKVAWCNPPFCATGKWTALAASVSYPVIMLIPADTSTQWWRETVDGRASHVMFLPRVSFEKGKPGYRGNLALVMYIYKTRDPFVRTANLKICTSYSHISPPADCLRH